MFQIETQTLLVILAVGTVLGWLGGLFTRGSGLGVIGNIIASIFGAVLGFFFLDYFNIALADGIINTILTTTFGSVATLFLIGLLRG